MAFKSVDQQKYLHAHPEILGTKIKEWDESTNFDALPKRVSKHKKEKPKTLRHVTRPR